MIYLVSLVNPVDSVLTLQCRPYLIFVMFSQLSRILRLVHLNPPNPRCPPTTLCYSHDHRNGAVWIHSGLSVTVLCELVPGPSSIYMYWVHNVRNICTRYICVPGTYVYPVHMCTQYMYRVQHNMYIICTPPRRPQQAL